jgi:hypothetical protein
MYNYNKIDQVEALDVSDAQIYKREESEILDKSKQEKKVLSNVIKFWARLLFDCFFLIGIAESYFCTSYILYNDVLSDLNIFANRFTPFINIDINMLSTMEYERDLLLKVETNISGYNSALNLSFSQINNDALVFQ